MNAVYAGDDPIVLQWVGSATDQVDRNAADEENLEVLGSTTENFVYTSVTPCVIVDNR